MHRIFHVNRPCSAADRLLLAVAVATGSNAALAAGPFAYLPSHDDPAHTISVVDLSNPAAPAATFTVTGDAVEHTTTFYGAAYSHADGMLYVSDEGNETVFQVNTATGATVTSYAVGDTPRGIAVDPSGRHVYVANFGSSAVSVIDTVTRQVTSIGLPPGTSAFASPASIVLNSAGTRAYVTDASTAQRLCRINLVSPPDTIPDDDCVAVGEEEDAGVDANGVAISPDGQRVYVINHNEDSVSVVDTSSFTTLRSFPLGDDGFSPNEITVSASGLRAYIGTTIGKIIPLDLTLADDPAQNPVMPAILDDAFHSLQGMAMTPDGTHVLAVDNGASQLHFVNVVGDANTRDASVDVHQAPLAWSSFVVSGSIFAGGFDR